MRVAKVISAGKSEGALKHSLPGAKIERHMGVSEAEDLTGLSRWTWRRMAYDGRIASTKVGTRLLIPLSEIERILTEGARPRATQVA